MDSPQYNGMFGWLLRVKRFVEEILVEAISPKPMMNRLRTGVHFFVLIWRGFVDNRCPVRAAALSYTTLLALIPILAVVLSISKNFLHDSTAEMVPMIMDKMVGVMAPQLESMTGDKKPGDPQSDDVVISSRARQEAVQKIQQSIDNINAGTLGTVGTVFLVFVGVRLLVTVEQAFNDIWYVRQGRSLWRKIVYYWSTVTLGPVLLILAMYWTGRMEFMRGPGTLAMVPWFERFLLRALPFGVLWLAFSLMYGLIPNTSVRPRAAIAGGVFAGTLWQLNSMLSTVYVSRVVTYSKIYGTMGIIPVLLVGLYFSWIIVLLGAQVSYAAQNVRNYLQQRMGELIDQQGRELLACRAVLVACENFMHGRPAPTVEEIADRIGAPPQWLGDVIYRLRECNLLTRVAEEQSGIIPARPPEAITVADVLDAVRTKPKTTTDTLETEANPIIEKLLGDLHSAEHNSPSNRKFSELVSSHPS